jgi:predicted transcriptional regulator
VLSFRVDDAAAAAVQQWAERAGVDRSELLREALRRHVERLAREGDADRGGGELALAAVAPWGPAEDWSDGVDATR